MDQNGVYLLLGQVLAVQRAGGLADVHEGLDEAIAVALSERDTHVDHGIWRSGTKMREALWKLHRLVHAHGATHGVSERNGKERGEEQTFRNHV